MGERKYTSTILTWALDVGEWSASRSCHFKQGETAPGTYFIRGGVDYQNPTGFHEEEKPLLPPPSIELRFLGRPARCLINIPNEFVLVL
jgi:hypothetical protein